jgi:hypothetical protein
LLVARRYGNFPTVDYEIASARLAAGLYRDAADILAKSFSIKDGVIQTKLGGRVSRESGVFTELVGFERRASIFAPTAADDPGSAAQLAALLQFRQELAVAQPDTGIVLKAADEFVGGDDPMKIYRQLFTASQLLEKKVGLAKGHRTSRSGTSFPGSGFKNTRTGDARIGRGIIRKPHARPRPWRICQNTHGARTDVVVHS